VLRPLMTALVTAAGHVPIAFKQRQPAREIMGPMAASLIGGPGSQRC